MRGLVAASIALLCLGAPAPASSIQQSVPLTASQELQNVILEYRTGNPDKAIGILESWPTDQVDARLSAAADLKGDPWDRATLALVVTESGLRKGTFGVLEERYAEIRPGTLGGRFEPGTRDARDLILHLQDEASKTKNRDLLAFCSTWWQWTSSLRMRLGLGVALPPDYRSRFKDDPALLTLHGSFLEELMGPVLEGGDVGSPFPSELFGIMAAGPVPLGTYIESVHGRFFADTARDAERDLRRAISLAPDLPEPRVRLARVLYQQGRHKDALTEFNKAIATAQVANDAWSRVVANLLLGRLSEFEGRLDQAESAYRAAVEPNLPGQSARVALGGLLVRKDRPEEGWRTLRESFAGASSASGPTIDPWVAYPHGALRLAAELQATLRAQVRRSTEAAVSTAAPEPQAQLLPPHAAPVVSLNDLRVPARQAFRAQVDGVRMDVRVTANGVPIQGLTAEDFEIRDNGVLQEVTFRPNPSRINVVLLSDRSASAGRATGLLFGAATVLTGFLEPDDLASLVTFSDRIELLAFQQPAREVARLVGGAAENQSRTILRDAIASSVSLVAEDPSFPWVVVLSDGADNASWTEVKELSSLLMRSTVVVDCVLAKTDRLANSDETYGPFFVDEFTKPTGGSIFDAESGDLTASLRRRVQEIRAAYVLTFVPTGVKQGDGRHSVTVKLKNRSGVVQTRAGYYSAPRSVK